MDALVWGTHSSLLHKRKSQKHFRMRTDPWRDLKLNFKEQKQQAGEQRDELACIRMCWHKEHLSQWSNHFTWSWKSSRNMLLFMHELFLVTSTRSREKHSVAADTANIHLTVITVSLQVSARQRRETLQHVNNEIYIYCASMYVSVSPNMSVIINTLVLIWFRGTDTIPGETLPVCLKQHARPYDHKWRKSFTRLH